jgi:sodium transport system permease protein
MMSVSVLARSFKEAQNYVSPLFIFIVLPVSAASFPGIELTATTQFIPLTNISLLFRDLIVGEVQIHYFFTVFLCTCVYAIMSLVLATWMFQREEVILSEDKGLPLTLDRRSFTPSLTPTAGTAMGLFALVMLLLFYVGGYVQGREIYSGLIITQYLLILLPVIFVLKYVKVSLPTALNLKPTTPLAVLAVVLCSTSWVLINSQLGVWHNAVLPPPPEFAAAMEEIFTTKTVPLYALIFMIAISPAICEEVLFRGAITSGLRNIFSPKVTVLLVGLLFGLFHLSIYRFALTGLTGIILTYFVIRSGSIYLSILAHFINNAIGVILAKEALPLGWIEYLEDLGIEENGFPMTWFFAAIVVFIAGIVLFEKSIPGHTKGLTVEEPDHS